MITVKLADLLGGATVRARLDPADMPDLLRARPHVAELGELFGALLSAEAQASFERLFAYALRDNDGALLPAAAQAALIAVTGPLERIVAAFEILAACAHEMAPVLRAEGSPLRLVIDNAKGM